jgi:hypothetical protein
MDYESKKYLFLEDIPNYENIWHYVLDEIFFYLDELMRVLLE